MVDPEKVKQLEAKAASLQTPTPSHVTMQSHALPTVTRADGTLEPMIQPANYASHADYQRMQRLYEQHASMQNIAAGATPYTEILKEQQFNAPLRTGELPYDKIKQIAAKSEQWVHAGSIERKQIAAEIKALAYGDQTPGSENFSLAPQQEQLQTRSQYLAKQEAARQQIEQWYEQTARNISQYIGRPFTASDLRALIPNLSFEQIQAVTSPNNYTISFAGPGAGKTTMMMAQYVNAVFNQGADPLDWTILSKTRSAVGALEDMIKKLTPILPELSAVPQDQLIFPGMTEEERLAKRQRMFQTLDTFSIRSLIHPDAQGVRPIRRLTGNDALNMLPIAKGDDASSTRDYLEKVIRNQGKSTRYNDPNVLDEYISETKGGYQPLYNERMARGASIHEAGDWDVRQQLDPDHVLYLYEKALAHAPGFEMPDQQGPLRDLHDMNILFREAAEKGMLPQMGNYMVDEVQDSSVPQIMGLRRLSSAKKRGYFGGDMGQQVVPHQYRIDQVLSHMFKNAASTHTLTGNNRSGANIVAQINAINASAALNGTGKSPMQVAAQDISSLPPTYSMQQDVPATYRQMIADWMKVMRTSPQHIQARMDTREPGEPLFHQGMVQPQRAPFVFQMGKQGRNVFLNEILPQELRRGGMDEEHIGRFLREHVTNETPRDENSDKLHALMIQQVRSRSTDLTFADATRGGMWDTTGYIRNMYTMLSRARIQNRIYASATNFPYSRQHNVDPVELGSFLLPPGFDAWTQGMAEDLVSRQGLSRQDLKPQLQDLLDLPPVFHHVPPKQVAQGAVTQAYTDRVLDMLPVYQAQVGEGSGITQDLQRRPGRNTEDEENPDLDDGLSTKGYISASVVSGQTRRAGDHFQMELIRNKIEDLARNGSQEAIPEFSDFFRDARAMSQTVNRRQRYMPMLVAPDSDLSLPDYTQLAERTSAVIPETDNSQKDFAPRDHGSYQGADFLKIRQNMRDLLKKSPDFYLGDQQLSATSQQFYNHPDLLNMLRQKMMQRTDPRAQDLLKRLNVAQRATPVIKKWQAELDDLQRGTFLYNRKDEAGEKISVPPEVTELNNAIGKIQAAEQSKGRIPDLSQAELEAYQTMLAQRVQKYYSPEQQQRHDQLTAHLAHAGGQSAQQLVSRIIHPTINQYDPDQKQMQQVPSPHYDSELSRFARYKATQLMVNAKMTPAMLQMLANRGLSLMPGIDNPDARKHLLDIIHSFQGGREALLGSGIDQEGIALNDDMLQGLPLQEQKLLQQMFSTGAGGYRSLGSDDATTAINQLVTERGKVTRFSTDDPAIPMQFSHLAPALTAIQGYASSLEGNVRGTEGGIADPDAVRALPSQAEVTRLQGITGSDATDYHRLKELADEPISDEDFQFHSLGSATPLSTLETRYTDMLGLGRAHQSGNALLGNASPDAREYLTTISNRLDTVQRIRQAMQNPDNHLRWAQTLRVVQRATTGEDVSNRGLPPEGLSPKEQKAWINAPENRDPVRTLFEKRTNDLSGGTRTMDSLIEFISAMNQASEHIEKTGTIRRAHLDRVLGALHQDPNDPAYTMLRQLEQQAGFSTGRRSKDRHTEIPLSAITANSPAGDRGNAAAQLTRVPLLPGREYRFRGGRKGYDDLTYTQNQLFGKGKQISASTHLVGTLHPFVSDGKEIPFGLAQSLATHRKHYMLSSQETKAYDSASPDMPLRPLLEFRTQHEGQSVSFPVHPGQLEMIPTDRSSQAQAQQQEAQRWQQVAEINRQREGGESDERIAKAQAAAQQARQKRISDMQANREHFIRRKRNEGLALLKKGSIPARPFQGFSGGYSPLAALQERLAALPPTVVRPPRPGFDPSRPKSQDMYETQGYDLSTLPERPARSEQGLGRIDPNTVFRYLLQYQWRNRGNPVPNFSLDTLLSSSFSPSLETTPLTDYQPVPDHTLGLYQSVPAPQLPLSAYQPVPAYSLGLYQSVPASVQRPAPEPPTRPWYNEPGMLLPDDDDLESLMANAPTLERGKGLSSFALSSLLPSRDQVAPLSPPTTAALQFSQIQQQYPDSWYPAHIRSIPSRLGYGEGNYTPLLLPQTIASQNYPDRGNGIYRGKGFKFYRGAETPGDLAGPGGFVMQGLPFDPLAGPAEGVPAVIPLGAHQEPVPPLGLPAGPQPAALLPQRAPGLAQNRQDALGALRLLTTMPRTMQTATVRLARNQMTRPNPMPSLPPIQRPPLMLPSPGRAENRRLRARGLNQAQHFLRVTQPVEIAGSNTAASAKTIRFHPLSSDQRQAIDDPAYHHIFQGGPGAGKSDILSSKLLDMFSKGTIHPSTVVSTSPMHSGVSELNARYERNIRPLLPNHGYSLPAPRTLHSLASSIVFPHGTPSPHLSAIGRGNVTGILANPTEEELSLLGPKEQDEERDKQYRFLRQTLISTFPHEANLPKSNQELQYALNDIGNVKLNRYMPGSDYDERMARGQQDITAGNYTENGRLAAYETQMQQQGYVDFNDLPAMAQQLIGHTGVQGLPAYLQSMRGMVVDEGQDLVPAFQKLLQSILSVLPQSPHMLVSLDPMQQIVPGAIPAEKVIPTYHQMMQSTGQGIAHHQLNENYRSDQETIAFNNAILRTKAMANDQGKSPLQRPPDHMPIARGRPPEFLLAKSQPAVYQKAFSKMLDLSGVDPARMKQNIEQGQHPFEGVDWSQPGMTKPGDIVAQFPMPAEREVFEHVAPDVLQNRLGVNQMQARSAFQQMYRAGIPGKDSRKDEQELFANRGAFRGLTVGQSRGLDARYVMSDVGRVGQWINNENESSHLRNLFIEGSRTQHGGQNFFMAASNPFNKSQMQSFVRGTPFVDDGETVKLGGKSILPKNTTVFEHYQGQTVPNGFKEILGLKDQELQGFTKQGQPSPSPQPSPSLTTPTIVDSTLAPSPPSSSSTSGGQQIDTTQPITIHGKDIVVNQSGGMSLAVPSSQALPSPAPANPTSSFSATPPSGWGGGPLSGKQIYDQITNPTGTSPSSPSSGQGSSRSTGRGGGSRSGSGGGLVSVGNSSGGNAGDIFINATGGGGSRSGGGGGGNKFASTISNLGRTAARIGSEMQFVGQLFTTMTGGAVTQGSQYRRATVPMTGGDGTSGFFNYMQGQQGIAAYQSGTLPMYSDTQIAQNMQAMLGMTNARFSGQQTLGPLTDMLGISAMTGIDPTQLMQQMTYATSYTSQSPQSNLTNTQHLSGMLGSLYGNNLTATNVTNTLGALDNSLPTLQGISPSSSDNQTAQLMSIFKLALGSGMSDSSLGNVSTTVNSLAQMGSAPNLQQQYALSNLFGSQNMTANPDLVSFNTGQHQRQEQLQELDLQQNIGNGLSLPNLQIQISQATISMDKAQLDLSSFQQQENVAQYGASQYQYQIDQAQYQASQFQQQYATAQYNAAAFNQQYNQAQFNQNQYMQNQLYGPIGADASRTSYYNWLQNQQATQYNGLSPESATQLQPSQTFGLKNEEFYSSMENQRSQLVLNRSPLLSDAAFQNQMKNIDQQENFYKQEIDLQNQQRAFDKDWQQKQLDVQNNLLTYQKKQLSISQNLLDMQGKYLSMQGNLLTMQGKQITLQGNVLDIQKSQFGLQQEEASYEQQELTLQNTYLPTETSDIAAMSVALQQQIQGEGPVNGGMVQPDQIIQALAGQKLSDKSLRAEVNTFGLPPDQRDTLVKLVEELQKNGGNMADVEKQLNSSSDKGLNADLQNMIKQGAFQDLTHTASASNASLDFAGVGANWQKLIGYEQSIDTSLKSIASFFNSRSPLLLFIGEIGNILGPLFMIMATIMNSLGFFSSLFGGGAGAAGAGTAGLGATALGAFGLAGGVGVGMIANLINGWTQWTPQSGINDQQQQGNFWNVVNPFQGMYDSSAGMKTWWQAWNDPAYADKAYGKGTGNIVKGVDNTLGGWGQDWNNAWNPNYWNKQQQPATSAAPSAPVNRLAGLAGNASSSVPPQSWWDATIGGFFSKTLPGLWNSTAGTFFGKTFPGWLSALNNDWNSMWGNVGAGWNTFFKKTLPGWTSALSNDWNKMWGNVGAGWNTFFEKTVPGWGLAIEKGWNALWTGIDNYWNTFFGKTVPGWGLVIEKGWNNFWSGISTNWNKFWSDRGNDWNKWWTTAGKWFASIPGDISTFFTKTLPDELKKVLSNIPVVGGLVSGGSAPPTGTGNAPGHPGFTVTHVNQEFGVMNAQRGYHAGVDLAASQGSPLGEMIGGEVTAVGWHPWGGEVDVAIPGGMIERYVHLSGFGVKPGDVVKQGDFIGLSGGGTPQSGLGYYSDGPHLHIEYDAGQLYGTAVSPWNVWAAFSDYNIAKWIDGSYPKAKAEQGGQSGAGSPTRMQQYLATGAAPTREAQPLRGHLATGGIVNKRSRVELGEQEPEAVIPLSKLADVMNKLPIGLGGSGTSSSTNNSKSIVIQNLIGSLTIQTNGGGSLSETEQDEIMAQLLDLISAAAQSLMGKLQ
jgi:superfamily I DNA/RNA helicase/murein DD-endopeptidase MepM/ murein hydrolase activator NlpD